MTEPDASLTQWLEDQEGDESASGRGTWRAQLANFYQWSLNYDYERSPFTLFRDLVGWSEEAIGGNTFDYSSLPTSLGYLELDLLGEALRIYADKPTDVTDWLDQLSYLELEGPDE
jgi:hypothetical protein